LKITTVAFVVGLTLGCCLLGAAGLSALAFREYGPASRALGPIQVVEYSARLLWHDGLLTKPADPAASEVEFEIDSGESIASICVRLQEAGLIQDRASLRDYLIYKGLDTTVRSGVYRLSGRRSAVDIAGLIQDPTPTEVAFVVLPGWRLEEISASLPTSGLLIPPAAFVSAASMPMQAFEFVSGAQTAEGFLFPDTYRLPRSTDATSLVNRLVAGFAAHLDSGLADGFAGQGLTTYEAVTLASIVQREAVVADESPLIASVYLNRYEAGMRLDADPTVQYALGFNTAEQTWWTSPLTLDDLRVESPYNTYLHDGLPPTPISNPGLEALQAIAHPIPTKYLFFSARCDQSGLHNFAETFEEHLRNLCP
jgi:UPF0755 protein